MRLVSCLASAVLLIAAASSTAGPDKDQWQTHRGQGDRLSQVLAGHGGQLGVEPQPRRHRHRRHRPAEDRQGRGRTSSPRPRRSSTSNRWSTKRRATSPARTRSRSCRTTSPASTSWPCRRPSATTSTSKVIGDAVEFLKKLQWDEGEGKTPKDDFYGGAGYDSKSRPDLSNTQFFLDALKAAGVPQGRPGRARRR